MLYHRYSSYAEVDTYFKTRDLDRTSMGNPVGRVMASKSDNALTKSCPEKYRYEPDAVKNLYPLLKKT